MTKTMTPEELTALQYEVEAKYSTEAYNRAIEEFHNNLLEGNEHKNLSYSIDAITAVVPTIREHIVALVTMKNQHGNKFWWNELRPLVKAELDAGTEDNKKKKVKTTATLMAEMVALNLIASLSKETPVTSLIANMKDAAFNLLKIKYELRPNHEFQAMKFFLGCINYLEENKCEVFKFYKLADSTEMVGCADEWLSRVEEAASKVKAGAFSHVPMVSIPNDHTHLFDMNGGALSLNTPLLKKSVRINGKIHEDLLNFTIETDPMLFKEINKAQKIPFQVNKKLLDVITKAYQNKKFFSKYPSKYKQVKDEMEAEANDTIVQLSRVLPEVFPQTKSSEHKKTKAKGMEMVRKTKDILTMAKDFCDLTMYYNLYLDDRSRAYTYVHTGSLTYMGGELAKALVQFANKEVLNEDGVSDLYQALGNCLGYDKHSIATKEAVAREWFETNKADFMAGKFDVFFDEQGEFDEAINALAVVMELVEYTKDSNYLCGYMSYKDARCSGSSIIGTMLGDKLAMTLTSVIDVVKDGKDKLPDAYMAVSNKGYEMNTDPYFKKHANVLFTRTVWKTPVMTRGSYGASMYTIHNGKKKKGDYISKTGNVALFIKEGLDVSKAKDFTKLMMETLDTSLPSCSLYLGDINIAAAAYIDEHKYYKVRSPITNFPMVRRKEGVDESSLESPGQFSRRIQLVIYKSDGVLDKTKLLSAVAPDTIHLMDASLLFRVKELVSHDVTSVHDAIASHPNNSNKTIKAYAQAMNELITEDAIGNIFGQLGAKAPRVNTVTAEEVADILNSKHILC